MSTPPWPEACLRGVAHAAGAWHHLAPDSSRLAQAGFDRYAVHEGHTAELLGRAARQCLADAAQSPAEVDAVLVATEAFWDHQVPGHEGRFDPHVRLRHALLQALADAGIGRAALYGNWLNACANLGSTLGLARALVCSGQHRRVLVLMGERHPPHLPRVMRHELGLLSDVATAALVEAGSGGLRIVHAASLACPALAAQAYDATATQAARLLQESRRCLQSLLDGLQARTGLQARDAAHLVVENFAPRAFALLLDVLGVPAGRLQRGSCAAFAHTGAADPLLTLAALQAQGRVRRGETVVLFNQVAWAWSVVVLQSG